MFETDYKFIRIRIELYQLCVCIKTTGPVYFRKPKHYIYIYTPLFLINQKHLFLLTSLSFPQQHIPPPLRITQKRNQNEALEDSIPTFLRVIHCYSMWYSSPFSPFKVRV